MWFSSSVTIIIRHKYLMFVLWCVTTNRFECQCVCIRNVFTEDYMGQAAICTNCKLFEQIIPFLVEFSLKSYKGLQCN